MKKFAAFDIDGTLIRWQLYHAVANEFAKEGLLGEDGHEALKSARRKWKNRESADSFKEYEGVLVKRFDAAITSISPGTFDETVKKVLDEYKLQIYNYTRDLLTQLKKEGYVLLAISGSPKEIVGPVAKYYGFDDFEGSYYKRSGEVFTGEKEITALDKKTALDKLVQRNKLTFTHSIAVGDTHSDISMLKMVEKPIAFNPERQLYNAAKANKWLIVIERKNVIYELEQQDGSYILV